MLTTSSLYNSIKARQHSVEWKIVINGTSTYGMTDIAANVGGGQSLPRITRNMFPGNTPVVGACVAAMFECAIYEASANVPRMATVVPSYRLVTETQQSEWIQLGVFYIDTRSVDAATGALRLSCYDRMLIADGAEGKSYADVTAFTTWPQSMSAVVNEIVSIMGITLDARTTISTMYMVEYPNDYTMREVLGYIATAHAGNFTITPDNKLRLVPLTGNADTLTLGTATQTLDTAPALTAWSGVTVYYGDEAAYSAGTGTGLVLTCDCPWATQAIANGILAAISGTQYQPFAANGAFPDLALELGDKLTVGYTGETIAAPIFGIDIPCDVLMAADLTSPGEAEIDHEYPYSDYVDRSLKRKVTLGQSYYGVSLSRHKGIEIKRSDGTSQALFNSDTFSMSALVDGVMTPRIYFDPVKGDYVFDGALGADAVFTDSLYAETGDIAELTVDRLSTSRRIRKYILGDTSDDNYINIQEQTISFITGTFNSSASPNYEQATNRYGQALYWQREPVSHTVDGYPTDKDGEQIYATTTTTNWPVYVYKYNELTKAQIYFALESGTYVPMLVMGAGDEHGYTKGTLHKSATGFDITFTTSAGDEIGLQALASGYLDLYGLRKPTNLDFSGWDNGTFTADFDGNKTESWTIDFDANDRPVKFTDSGGHETAVTWE